jgi:hypothetical protein
MTIYAWGNSASIEKMQVRPSGKKGAEAVLYAAPGAQKGDLAQIPDMLRSLEMTVIPDTIDGQHVLRVRGIKDGTKVADALEKNGFVSAASRQTQDSPKEEKQRKGVMQSIREKSLVASGYVYMIGDAALVLSGIKRKDMNELRTGLAFSSSSIVLAFFGKRDVGKAFDDNYNKMLKEFAKEGVEFPELKHVNTAELGTVKGVVSHVTNFLYNHPAEVNAAINAYAGYQSLQAGINLSKTDKVAGFNKAAAGVSVGSGFLIGLLVPEKGKKQPRTVEGQEGAVIEGDAETWLQPEEPPKGFWGSLMSPFQSVYSKIEERPLRASGYGAIINNGFLLASGITERKNTNKRIADMRGELEGLSTHAGDSVSNAENSRLIGDLQNSLKSADENKNNWMFPVTAAISYIVANSLLSISSKDTVANMTTEEDPFTELYTASAGILVNQPQDVQDAMINKMAFYLAEQKDITATPEEIAKMMREKLIEVQSSPWIDTRLEKLEDMAEDKTQGKAAESSGKTTHAKDKEAEISSVPDTVPQSWVDREMKAPDRVPAAWADKEAARGVAEKDAQLSGAAR